MGTTKTATAAERRETAAREKAERRAEKAERALDVLFGFKWEQEEQKLQRLAAHVQRAHERMIESQEAAAMANTPTERELTARKVGEASGCLLSVLAAYHHGAERVRVDRLRRKVTTEQGGTEHETRT